MFPAGQAGGVTPLVCRDSLSHGGSGDKWRTHGGKSRSGGRCMSRCSRIHISGPGDDRPFDEVVLVGGWPME